MHEIQAELQIGRARYGVSDLIEDDSGRGPSMVVHGLPFDTAIDFPGVLIPPNRGVGFSAFETLHSPSEVLTKVWFDFLD